jgi:hypothetical protein
MYKSLLDIRSVVTVLWLLVLMACADVPPAPDFNNPLDKSSPDYMPPQVVIATGPTANDTIGSAETTFTWTGNPQVTDYAYRLNDDHWSAWSTDAFCIVRNMAEGRNVFYVKGRYASNDDARDSVMFYVDAVRGPALVMRPGIRTLAVQEGCGLGIWADEVSNCMFALAVLRVDTSLLEIVAVERGLLFASSAGEPVLFTQISGDTLKITAGYAAMGGAAGTGGSGEVAVLRCRARKTGTTDVRILGTSSLRTPDQQIIGIRTMKNCTIRIEQ